MTMTPKELAERDGKPVALAWVAAAERALGRLLTARGDPVVRSALTINFSATGLQAYIAALRARLVFAQARDVIARSGELFFDASLEEAHGWFGENVPPAYALFGQGVWFTPRFLSFGPMCRAAMVLHESVHVIDAISGEPAIHVSEWDEPRFSAQSIEESLHNPSAYASFAAQVGVNAVDWPREVRYGAGRPDD